MAAHIYKNAAGKRIPSVTTVLSSLGWNKDSLLYWAWNEGIEGRNFRDTSTKAADVGTFSHLGIEAQIKGEEYDLDALDLDAEMLAKCKSCIGAWNTWKDQSKLEIIASELSLVSEEYQFGGTLDCACIVSSKHSILDIKTGGGVYADHLLQVRAYGHLWNENHQDKLIEEYHLIRLGKDDGSFHHHCYTAKSLDLCWESFKHLLPLYDAHKIIKKMAG